MPAPFAGPHFAVRMLQNSPPTRFRETFGPELRRSDRVSAYLNATLTGIETNEAESRVERVRVAALGGHEFTVQAGAYVLAAGGIENARLLLAAGRAGLGNPAWVGRNFMVHLQCPGGTVAVADPYSNFNFYTNVTSNGRDYEPFRHRFSTFISPSEATMRARALPQARIMWDFDYTDDIKTIRAVQGAISWHDAHRLDDVGTIMSDLGGAGTFLFRRLFMDSALPVRSLRLTCTFEPSPNPESRVLLGNEVDALGQRRVEVDWRVSDADRQHAREVMRLFGAELGRTGFGRLHSLLEGDDWPDEMFGDQHHMGTTMMSKDPARGVVDTDCRLHGNANLYVVGSSVFPHAGVANPTLTITALALRLGQHLRNLPA